MTRTALFWYRGKQYSYVTWFRVRKGPSDHEYEVNLPLAYTFLVKRVDKNVHLLMVQKCSLAHSINTTCGAKLLPCP